MALQKVTVTIPFMYFLISRFLYTRMKITSRAKKKGLNLNFKFISFSYIQLQFRVLFNKSFYVYSYEDCVTSQKEGS